MSIINFENERWKKYKQGLVFRHKVAIDFIEKGKVLDFGCGDGLFLEMLRKKEIEGVGFDISSEAIKVCKSKGLNARYFNIDVDDFVFDDNYFNYVVFLDNLEHLFNPEEVLKKTARITNEIIISVPNFNSLPARLQMLFGKIPENNKHKKGHVYWFNYFILLDMIKNINLEIIDLKMNTFWENKRLIGNIMKFLAKKYPNIFALSFVIKVKK